MEDILHGWDDEKIYFWDDKGKGNFYFLESRYYDDEIGFNFKTPSGTSIV